MSNLPTDGLSIVDIKRETDLAWAAGIIDGEGTIDRHNASYTHQNGNYYTRYKLRLRIPQATDDDSIPEMLLRLKNIFGSGNISPRKGTKKIQYVYTITDNNVKEVLQLLWPYLGTIKRKQAYTAGFRLTTWELGLEHLVNNVERDNG